MPKNAKATAILILVLIAGMKGFGQDERSKSCKIEILSPDEKEQVAESASVKGTVQKPAENNHLWLLAHRKGLALWWPQPTGECPELR